MMQCDQSEGIDAKARDREILAADIKPHARRVVDIITKTP